MNDASDFPRTTPPPSQSTDVAALVAQLRDQGIDLTLTDGRLRFNAPRGALDDATMGQLRARRDEIITFLSRPIPRPAEGLPASPGQARLWFVERAGLAGHGYITPVNLRIDGSLDPERLRLALQAVVHRHEALRTAFVERDGHPYQVVHPPVPFEMPITDLSAMQDRDAVLADLAARDNRRHFDLTQPPLLRARLVRLGAERHVLLAAFHHIAFDGWSLPVFLDELGRFYGGETLPPLRVQLPDLAAAQARRQDKAGLEFWRATLAGLERTELPTDRRPPAMPSGQGVATRFHLPGDVLGLAREEGTTTFVVLLTAFLLTLGREAGQEHPAVGIPVANRTEPGSEALIGFLVNTLVLRADLTGDPSFHVPFDRVVEALQPTRALSRTPLFATMFAVQDEAAISPRWHLPGLAVTSLDMAAFAARFDLEVHCWPDGDRCAGIAVRDGEALDHTDVARLLARWTSVLDAAAASPDAPISRLAPLLPEEAARLAALNDTDTGDNPLPLHRMFEATAARTPDAPALEAGGTSLTYAQLNATAERIARALIAHGAGPDVPVVLSLDRGPLLHAAMLGIMKAGACVVPLDPENPPARHAAVLQLAGAALGIVEPRLAGRLPGLRLIDPLTADGPWVRTLAPLPDNLAAIIFTSGSTGVPKGVEVTHFVFANVIRWHATQLGDRGRRTLGFTHQAFDVFFQEAFTTWALGGTLVLLNAEQRRDPEQIADFIETEGVERVFMPFTPLSQTVETLARHDAGHSLCELHTAGEAVLATPGLRGFLANRPGLRLVNHYGPTESYITTGHVVAPNEDPVPIGRPLPNLQVQVVDRWLRPVPPGATGEIAAGGRGIARGYRRRPDLTAERFRPDPNGPAGARVYLTGDRGRLAADGTLRYLGRSDHQVKLRGFRVEPAEIQRVLMDGPELRAATVGLLNGALVAHVVLADPSAISLATVRVRLGERLPDYMRPAAVVTLPALPLLQNGKVDRFALPAPEVGTVVFDRPRSATEEALVGLFAEVLGRPAIGIHEDFFSAGGHSLLATQLVSRIRAVLGVELPLRALFEAPSVAAIAAAMEAADAPPEPPRAGLAPTDLAPLSFAQARLWLLDRLGLAGYAYTIPVALRLRGALDIPALAAALVDLVTRHEPLRTACREIDGEPRQCVLPPPDAHLEVQEASEADLPALQTAEIAAPFDLANGRPFRMRLLRLGPDDVVLLAACRSELADRHRRRLIERYEACFGRS
jgi:amino acid adenylation domain-containing protein